MHILSFRQTKKRTISHGGWLYSGLILGWLCFPGGVWGEPPASPAPPTESRVSPPPVIPQASPSEKAAETQWRPLREVIQQYSESTGKRVRLSGRLQEEDKLFDQVYSANDTSWLEDFNRIEIFNDQTGKKEIILLNRKPGSPSGPSLNTRSPRKPSRKKIFRAKAGAPAASLPPAKSGAERAIRRFKENLDPYKHYKKMLKEGKYKRRNPKFPKGLTKLKRSKPPVTSKHR